MKHGHYLYMYIWLFLVCLEERAAAISEMGALASCEGKKRIAAKIRLAATQRAAQEGRIIMCQNMKACFVTHWLRHIYRYIYIYIYIWSLHLPESPISYNSYLDKFPAPEALDCCVGTCLLRPIT